MDSHKTSESEEMYLSTLARLLEQGAESPVPVSTLAGELDVLPVSANQMVRKLEEEGLAEYAPYKGVTLTESGRNKANQVLRLRRLWEVFLVEHLAYSVKEAEKLACELEHALPTEAGERLSIFLGHPTTNPSGAPIPTAQVEGGKSFASPLAAFQPGEWVQITHLSVDSAARSFLSAEGIVPGKKVQIQAYGAKGALLVLAADGRSLHLSPDLVRSIYGKGGGFEA